MGVVGNVLADPIRIHVRDLDGEPLRSSRVTWLTPDGGEVDGARQTDASGIASATWTLGPAAGDQRLQIRLESGAQVVVSASARAADPAGFADLQGEEQSAEAGRELPEPLEVTVEDEFGNPVPHVEVTWSATGNGVILDPTGVTDSAGVTAVRWRLGTDRGQQSAVLDVAGAGVATFHAMATGSPAAVQPGGGDDQEGDVGDPADDPLVVIVVDDEGQPIGNVDVQWSVTTGAGALLTLESTTGSDGRAQATWQFGVVAGTQQVTASVAGAGSFTFDAQVAPDEPDRMLVISGNLQVAGIGLTLGTDLTVQVVDQYDNPVPGIDVQFNVTAGLGSVSPASVQTDVQGRASTSWTLGALLGTQTVEVTIDAGLSVEFTATGI